MSASDDTWFAGLEESMKKLQDDLMALSNRQNVITEHNFETLAAQTKDEHEKKYYGEMHTLVTRLTATGLSRKQVLDHDETKKLIEQYKAQPAGLLIDNSGRSNGFSRSTTSATSTNNSTTTSHSNVNFTGLSFKRSVSSTQSSSSGNSSSKSFSFKFG